MNKPITLCDRCDIAASCLLNYDGVPCRKNRTVEPTNADRIRAMTDEELAEWFAARVTNANDNCPDKHGYKFCLEKNGCPACWLDWLRQEANE